MNFKISKFFVIAFLRVIDFCNLEMHSGAIDRRNIDHQKTTRKKSPLDRFPGSTSRIPVSCQLRRKLMVVRGRQGGDVDNKTLTLVEMFLGQKYFSLVLASSG